jgi:hypothetical protein
VSGFRWLGSDLGIADIERTRRQVFKAEFGSWNGIMNAFLAQASEFVCRFYRASSIEHRASSIQYRASSIQFLNQLNKLNKHNQHIP